MNALRRRAPARFTQRGWMMVQPYRFGTAGDPNFSQVILLLHGNGTNGSTTVTDSSSAARVPSAQSGVLTTTDKVFGTAAIGYSGGQVTRYTDSADFSHGTSNFTWQGFVRFTTTGTSVFAFGQSDSGGSNSSLSIAINRTSGNRIRAVAASGSSAIADITGTTAISSNTWYYVAFGRTGSTFNLYLGTSGTANLEGTASSASSINNSTNLLGVGCLGEVTTNTLQGQLEEMRWTIGTYRSDIATVPTAEFPNSA